MPVNTEKTSEVWNRYVYLRDHGHLKFIQKADRCDKFFQGLQWDSADLAALNQARRPALTINKIISTIANVLGEQIFNRTDIAFRPRNSGATSEVADALTKVFKQISDNNQLPWVRSDVFCDGVIQSRGFYDVRLDFSDNLRGEVRITQLNPKNVLIDSDADSYDPDDWQDVITTSWMTIDQIELLYGKANAELLRIQTGAANDWDYDAADFNRDRFGGPSVVGHTGLGEEQERIRRNIRVIERQYRTLHKATHFVDLSNGDSRLVPNDWDEAKIQDYLSRNPNIATTRKLVQRIRWTVIAGNVLLHDDWSPYRHFTVVPYFPYFRRGQTVGIVENLLGPQELLNKVSSQELHVVNTSANSGWLVRRNSLVNMSVAELEQRGAQTGLVLEVDDVNNVTKIQPNQTPSGLDRISYKAEEHIKAISGVSDYMQGFAREDVAAKSVVANQKSGQANMAKVMDNMNRTDHLLARAVLALVQEYYTEERLVRITADKMLGTTEEMVVNQVTPEGTILNDLTLGEYAIVVTNEPERDTFEDSQFDQAVRLRTEVGIQIPDKFIIQASRLRDKSDIITEMEGDPNSPEAQKQAELQQRMQEAEVAQKEADVAKAQADSQLSQARAQREQVMAQVEAQGEPAEQDTTMVELQKLQAEMELKFKQLEMEIALQREKMAQEMALKREELAMTSQLKAEESRNQQAIAQQQAIEKAKSDRIAAVHQRAQPRDNAQSPSGKPAAPAQPRSDKESSK